MALTLAPTGAPAAYALLQSPARATWKTAAGTPSATGTAPAVVPIFFATDLTVSYPDFGSCSTDLDCPMKGTCSTTTNLCEFRGSDVVMQTLQNSWGAVANVSFQRVAGRPADRPSVGVALTGSPYTTGGFSLIGPQPDNGVTDVLLYPCDESTGSAVDCSRGWEGFRWSIIHEFGHVLGFNHEHQRPDTPSGVASWCEAASAAERKAKPQENGIVTGGVTLTPSYDGHSVMGYCRDQNNDQREDGQLLDTVQHDLLSRGDIDGVRKLYGTANAAITNSLYVVSGMPPVGGVTYYGLFRLDPVNGVRRTPLVEGWSDVTSMTTVGTRMFSIRSSLLRRIYPLTGVSWLLGKQDWSGPTLMAGIGETLYVIQGGRLWQVTNLVRGSAHPIGDGDWSAATAMTALNGFLFVIRDGDLLKVDPLVGSYEEILIGDERNVWPGVRHLAAVTHTGHRENRLYIADGSSEIAEVDLWTGTVASRQDLGDPFLPIRSMVAHGDYVYVAKGTFVYEVHTLVSAHSRGPDFRWDIPLISAIY